MKFVVHSWGKYFLIWNICEIYIYIYFNSHALKHEPSIIKAWIRNILSNIVLWNTNSQQFVKNHTLKYKFIIFCQKSYFEARICNNWSMNSKQFVKIIFWRTNMQQFVETNTLNLQFATVETQIRNNLYKLWFKTWILWNSWSINPRHFVKIHVLKHYPQFFI